jgi:hypothetical protein
MDSFSIFISLAGFEGDWHGADSADEALMRHVLGGARHRVILLVDYGVEQDKNSTQVQFGNQIDPDPQRPLG